VIRNGDADAFAGFYDSRIAVVRAYCDELCVPELADDAVRAAFVDFLGRLRQTDEEIDLDELLRKAARSAAAVRMPVVPNAACAAMPELLAADANHERRGDAAAIQRHLERCASCRRTAARLMQAERAFGQRESAPSQP
jgi:hypothetical protein